MKEISNMQKTVKIHMPVFEMCEDCKTILPILHDIKILNTSEYQKLLAERTPIERNR